MARLINVCSSVLPVFLALLLGMFCRRIGFLDRAGINALKKVVINLTLPFVLFDAFAAAEYSPDTMVLPCLIFVACCAALGLGFLAVSLSGSGSRLVPFLTSGFEAGMLGYALFVMLFPQVSVSRFAILDLGQTLFVFTLYKFLLSGRKGATAVVRDMLHSPVLWAIAAGVLVGASGLYAKLHLWGMGGIVDGITGFLSAPTGAIILLTVGYDLVLKDVSWRTTAGFIAMRMGILALLLGLVILLNRTLLNSMIFEGAAILLFILPPPYVLPVFADEPGERAQLSGALSALTLVTLFLFAILCVVLGGG